MRLQNPLYQAYNENEYATREWLNVYEQAKKEIEAELFDAYRKINVEKPLISDFYRYNHLQKIEKQIEESIIQLGVREEDFTTNVLKYATDLGTKVVNNVLDAPILNKRAIDNVIKYPWHGANYSDRIWNNKAELIASMKSELTNGIIQGKSIYQVASAMEERLNVGKNKTQRLVRTEYMHALNQGQIESYKAAGYTKLRWSATMDSRTSEMCRERNGKEYPIDQLPDIPAHPNCRCTFIPVIDDDFIEARAQMLQEAKRGLENQEDPLEGIEYNDSLSKTNMKEKVGKENYDNFITHLSGIDNDRVKEMFNYLGDKLQFKPIANIHPYAQGSIIQLDPKSFDGNLSRNPMKTVYHEAGHAFDSLGIELLTGKNGFAIGKKKVKVLRKTVEVDDNIYHASALPKYKLRESFNRDLWRAINGPDLPMFEDLGPKPRKKIEKQEWEAKEYEIYKVHQENARNFQSEYRKKFKENPSAYSALSDIMESTGWFYGTLGAGHGSSYWKKTGMAETEFFAHATELVSNKEAEKVMREIFPTGIGVWEQLVDDILERVK